MACFAVGSGIGGTGGLFGSGEPGEQSGNGSLAGTGGVEYLREEHPESDEGGIERLVGRAE